MPHRAKITFFYDTADGGQGQVFADQVLEDGHPAVEGRAELFESDAPAVDPDDDAVFEDDAQVTESDAPAKTTRARK